LPEDSRVVKFINLHKEFDPDEAELTRTRKIRRDFMEQRYGSLISAVYSDKEEIVESATITYQDGRKGTISTSIKVNVVEN
jgi:long-chain acyl-CoA synthetase